MYTLVSIDLHAVFVVIVCRYVATSGGRGAAQPSNPDHCSLLSQRRYTIASTPHDTYNTHNTAYATHTRQRYAVRCGSRVTDAVDSTAQAATHAISSVPTSHRHKHAVQATQSSEQQTTQAESKTENQHRLFYHSLNSNRLVSSVVLTTLRPSHLLSVTPSLPRRMLGRSACAH